jgi:acetoin utilization protein AcuB
MLVHEYMTEDPIKVSEGTPLDVAWQSILEHSFRQLPVCDGEQLVGIVNRTDLLRWNPRTGKDVSHSATPTVGNVMTPDPVTIRAVDPIEEAISKIETKKIGSLPVVDADRLVGILTRTDVFELLSQMFGVQDESKQYKFTADRFSKCLEAASERASENRPVSFIAFREPGDTEWQNAISLRTNGSSS